MSRVVEGRSGQDAPQHGAGGDYVGGCGYAADALESRWLISFACEGLYKPGTAG